MMPEKLKNMDKIPIAKPEIRADPNIAHQMQLDKHARSKEQLKYVPSKKSTALQSKSNLYDADTAAGDSPGQDRSGNIKDGAEYGDIEIVPQEVLTGDDGKKEQTDVKTKQAPLMEVNNTIDILAFHNPKNYRYLPPQFTSHIREAGKYTAPSEGISGVITGQFVA